MDLRPYQLTAVQLQAVQTFIVQRKMLPNQLRLRFEGDLAGESNRKSILDRVSNGIPETSMPVPKFEFASTSNQRPVRTLSMYQPDGPMWVQ